MGKSAPVLAFAIFSILVFAAAGFALTLSGTIRDGFGTRLTGTHVELLQAGTVLASTTAASEGAYKFNISTPGSYTLRLNRYGYPEHVVPITIGNEDTRRDVVMTETSLSSVYGQVFYDGGNPDALGKVRLSKNGVYVIGAESQIRPDGSYVITGVQPGDYQLVLPEGNYEYEKPSLSFVGGETRQVNIQVTKIKPQPKPDNNTTPPVVQETFSIVAPATALQGEWVTIKVFEGSQPVAGAVLLASAGGFETTLDPTDKSGSTKFKPQKTGKYTFKYAKALATMQAIQKQALPKPEPVQVDTGNQKQEGFVAAAPAISLTIFLIFVGLAFLAALVVMFLLRHKARERRHEAHFGHKQAQVFASAKDMAEKSEPEAHGILKEKSAKHKKIHAGKKRQAQRQPKEE